MMHDLPRLIALNPWHHYRKKGRSESCTLVKSNITSICSMAYTPSIWHKFPKPMPRANGYNLTKSPTAHIWSTIHPVRIRYSTWPPHGERQRSRRVFSGSTSKLFQKAKGRMVAQEAEDLIKEVKQDADLISRYSNMIGNKYLQAQKTSAQICPLPHALVQNLLPSLPKPLASKYKPLSPHHSPTVAAWSAHEWIGSAAEHQAKEPPWQRPKSSAPFFEKLWLF